MILIQFNLIRVLFDVAMMKAKIETKPSLDQATTFWPVKLANRFQKLD